MSAPPHSVQILRMRHIVRFRPPTEKEAQESSEKQLFSIDAEGSAVTSDLNFSGGHRFQFDKVIGVVKAHRLRLGVGV